MLVDIRFDERFKAHYSIKQDQIASCHSFRSIPGDIHSSLVQSGTFKRTDGLYSYCHNLSR